MHLIMIQKYKICIAFNNNAITVLWLKYCKRLIWNLICVYTVYYTVYQKYIDTIAVFCFVLINLSECQIKKFYNKFLNKCKLN